MSVRVTARLPRDGQREGGRGRGQGGGGGAHTLQLSEVHQDVQQSPSSAPCTHAGHQVQSAQHPRTLGGLHHVAADGGAALTEGEPRQDIPGDRQQDLAGNISIEGVRSVRALPRDAAKRNPGHEQPGAQPRRDSDDPEERICPPGGVYRVPAVRAQQAGGGQDVHQGQGGAAADGRDHHEHRAETVLTLTVTNFERNRNHRNVLDLFLCS